MTMPTPDPSNPVPNFVVDDAAKRIESDAGVRSPDGSEASKKRLPKQVRLAIRYGVGLLILAAVSRQGWRTWAKWQAQGDLFEISYLPMLGSLLAYLIGLVFFGIYYGVIVRGVKPATAMIPCVRAYLYSHPAKYVPGKAMVVVVRVGVLGKADVGPAAASFTAIFETLSMMAIGGLLGGVLLILPEGHLMGAAVSFGLGTAFFCTVLPWTFGRAVRLLKKGLPAIDPADCPRPSKADTGKLAALGVGGWLAWGVSGVLTVSALSGGALRPLAEWPRIAGAVMVGTAGGFALPILPGGLGLREGIYHEVTKGVLGPDLAIASALALRFVWVVGEVIAVAAISLISDGMPNQVSKNELSP
ncbi:hypothetical protein GC170_07645 [bacterium]|nr:hypothetical protein [bacterium]